MPEEATSHAASEASGDPDGRWFDDFTMQMTIQQAPPDFIKRAVADVRSHCSDSHESPHVAFGDPRAYATTLASQLPQPGKSSHFGFQRVVVLLPVTLGLALYIILFLAEQSGQVPITVGHLLIMTVAVPAWVVLSSPWARPRPRKAATPDRPAFDEKGWRGLAATVGFAMAVILVSAILTDEVFTVSTTVMWASASVLMVSGLLLLLMSVRRTAHSRRSR